MVGSVTGRGAPVRRARIISEPASDYIRFEHEVTPAANLAAGEQVRWLPRRNASDLALPGNDCWLFDGTAVLFNYFSGDGTAAGTELRDEPAVVKLCAAAFAAGARPRASGCPPRGPAAAGRSRTSAGNP
ncbi:MAG TPA: hypothetical protein VFQ68_45645 [Streptosporangiaceae bacterium]|nr:hypothetical protein [Streptosporangiaceae bacterium]